jgi:hypothetical protein
MSTRADYFAGLLDLPTYPERPVRRTVFRQSVASLALSTSADGPSPLDGIRPEALLRSIKVAIADGLLEDLSWLAPSAAGVALYEIAAALPLGRERRDIARRVLAQLYEGNASTFVAIASRIAAGSGRGLSGAGVRARVAIVTALPASAHIPVDALAYALTSRRELARDWLTTPSTASLPDRRLAGRLLERATREAVRRAAQGGEHALRLFRNTIITLAQPRRTAAPASSPDPIASVLLRLLADRETLVWRHVAAARGLLSGSSPELTAEISELLSPEYSPTEWRRAATSLVASIAIDPQRSLSRSIELLRSPLLQKDPAIATSMVWGLRCAADLEPEAAEELLNAIAAAAPVPVAESVAELRNELGAFGAKAAELCKKALSTLLTTPEPDDGLLALARAILRDLSSDAGEGSDLLMAIRVAESAFIETAAREAHTRALSALAVASETVSALEALELTDEASGQASMSRRAAASLLRDLDAHLLESGLLQNLLLLDRSPSDDTSGVAPLDDLYERLNAWLIRSEASSSPSRKTPPHVTLHQRKLRALLHLIDGGMTDFGDDPDRRSRVRTRWTTASNVLVARLETEKTVQLRRAITATVARALDALVRDVAADAADILLFAAMRMRAPNDLEILAEASMHPDVTLLVQAYARFVRRLDQTTPDKGNEKGTRRAQGLAAMEMLVGELPTGATQRTEVVRGALSRLARGLAAVAASSSLSQLAASGAEGSPLASLDEALARLAQLTAGARRRCGDDLVDDPPTGDSMSGRVSQPMGTRPESPLLVAIRRALNTPSADPSVEVLPALEDLYRSIEQTIPPALADLSKAIVARISGLPLERASAPSLHNVAEQSLPAWMPTRRTLGGFYVHRQLGGGSLGTVFVVTRAEERTDPDAERFALKVPDYDATAARSVSESDFLKLFREEAGALLSVPEHKNLARFVTFDAGARPKPILVMELVEGIRCDHLIGSRGLTMELAINIVDGMLAGLEAMHSVEVGHLDVKPANVVLRGGKEPVLVDFGLAGRHIRPGCATAAYGAPEVWGVVPDGVNATPLTADVYAFGCVAYEVLTTQTLFDEPSDMATVSAHLLHDGLPGPVRKLAENPRFEPLGMFLFHALRHNPADRPTATELRKRLKALGDHLRPIKWPVDPG